MLIYLEIKKCQNNPQMKEITTKTFKYFKLKDNGNTTHNLIQQKSHTLKRMQIKCVQQKTKSHNLINFD